MTAALKNQIPAGLDESGFTESIEGVQSSMVPRTEEEWAEKLDHALSQARQGQKSDASTLAARIRALYR